MHGRCEVLHSREILAILREKYGEQFKFPSSQLPSWLVRAVVYFTQPQATRDFVSANLGYPPKYSNSKILKVTNPSSH